MAGSTCDLGVGGSTPRMHCAALGSQYSQLHEFGRNRCAPLLFIDKQMRSIHPIVHPRCKRKPPIVRPWQGVSEGSQARPGISVKAMRVTQLGPRTRRTTHVHTPFVYLCLVGLFYACAVYMVITPSFAFIHCISLSHNLHSG